MKIHELISAKRKEAEEDFARQMINITDSERLAGFMSDVLPDMVDISRVFTYGGDITISLPRVSSEITKYEEKFKAHVLKNENMRFDVNDSTPDDGIYEIRIIHKFKEYKYGYGVLSLKFCPNIKGSTCFLTKIGERKIEKVVPIYEVTCSEGAGTFAEKEKE